MKETRIEKNHSFSLEIANNHVRAAIIRAAAGSRKKTIPLPAFLLSPFFATDRG
jgi:hypothetical protein